MGRGGGEFEEGGLSCPAAFAGFPKPPIRIEPFARIFQGRYGEPTRAALRITLAHDQPGMLEHPEMLGHGGERHVEWLGKF